MICPHCKADRLESAGNAPNCRQHMICTQCGAEGYVYAADGTVVTVRMKGDPQTRYSLAYDVHAYGPSAKQAVEGMLAATKKACRG